MLFLLFQVGNDRYALEAGRVIEVVPYLQLERIPQAPKGVAGLFNYRGRPVPAVDLSALTLDKPAQVRLSTRIVVVQCPDSHGTPHLLGLIAEQATDLMRRDAGDFSDADLHVGAVPFLGAVIVDRSGVIRRIHADRLLPERARDLLFSEVEKFNREDH
jgi:chemotaxis-related protein WspB